jgi:tRNA threonylcarbamoyladenosine biosynthesis protein TsaB
MKILSIDASSQILSIALLIDGVLLEKQYPSGKNHSDNIISNIRTMISNADLSFKDINAIAFGAGPGSFTGLRIAAGVAYGMAYANNLPIVGINNLEALAKQSGYKNTIACIDARMGQIYLGAYKKNDDKYVPLIEGGLFDPSNLPAIDVDEAIIIGSGVRPYKNILMDKYKTTGIDIDENEHSLAGSIALLAIHRFGSRFNLDQAGLIYLRNKVAQTVAERFEQKKSKLK